MCFHAQKAVSRPVKERTTDMSTDNGTGRFLQAFFGSDDPSDIFFVNLKPTKYRRSWRKINHSIDCYLTPGRFGPEAERNTGDTVREVAALVLDDVGTAIDIFTGEPISKVTPEQARRLGAESAIIRTSPDNHHYWFKLSRPVLKKEWKIFRSVVDRIIGAKPDGTPPSHLFRAPFGRNVKRGNDVELTKLVDGDVLDVDAMLASYTGPDVASEATTGGSGGSVRDVVGLAALIPNLKQDYCWWEPHAQRFYGIAIDKEQGREAFLQFSAKNTKAYDPDETERVWKSLTSNGKTVTTSGKELLAEAEAADPAGYKAWQLREMAVFDDGVEPPDPFDEVEFFADQERSAIEVVKYLGGTVKQVGRGDWREFNPDTGRWREWTGDHMFRRVLELVNARKKRPLDPEVSKKLGSVKFIEHIARAAALHVSVIAKSTDFDRAPLLLGVPSGVIDLGPQASREIRRGRASEMVSKAMWVDPAPAGTSHPQWSRFLQEFTYGKTDLEEWLQVRAGYCLTGLMDEYIMPFYHGSGGNGKSVYLNALRSVWGEYGTQMDHRLLFEKQGGYHLAPLAVLAGVRLAIVTDVPQDAVWDALIMKMLTGDDAITANRMHQNPITFKSTAKVDVSGNGEPVVKDMDEGIRRRLMAIPLTAKPKVIDKQLSRKLGGEYEAILRWALTGLDKYWALGGFPAAKSVEAATKEYHTLLDPFQRWLDTLEPDPTPGAKLKSTELFSSWDAFRCGEGKYGMTPVNTSTLIKKMKAKDFVFSTLDGSSVLWGYKFTPDSRANVF